MALKEIVTSTLPILTLLAGLRAAVGSDIDFGEGISRMAAPVPDPVVVFSYRGFTYGIGSQLKKFGPEHPQHRLCTGTSHSTVP